MEVVTPFITGRLRAPFKASRVAICVRVPNGRGGLAYGQGLAVVGFGTSL